jgi:hypothetical protein
MCPACLTTLAAIVTGATSVSGLTAVVVNKLRDSTGTTTNAILSRSIKETDHDHDHQAQDRNT